MKSAVSYGSRPKMRTTRMPPNVSASLPEMREWSSWRSRNSGRITLKMMYATNANAMTKPVQTSVTTGLIMSSEPSPTTNISRLVSGVRKPSCRRAEKELTSPSMREMMPPVLSCSSFESGMACMCFIIRRRMLTCIFDDRTRETYSDTAPMMSSLKAMAANTIHVQKSNVCGPRCRTCSLMNGPRLSAFGLSAKT